MLFSSLDQQVSPLNQIKFDDIYYPLVENKLEHGARLVYLCILYKVIWKMSLNYAKMLLIGFAKISINIV